MKHLETQFNLYFKGVYYGTVWLTTQDLANLTYIGRAVSGLARYQSKTQPNAIYVSV